MNELEIKALGTVSPFCFKNYNCSGYLIKYNNCNYLLDAGNGISRYMDVPNDLNNLKVFITHLHPDHYEEISVLCQSALVYKRLGLLKDDIEIYIPNNLVELNNIDAYNYIHSLEKDYPIKVTDYNNLDFKNKNLIITSLLVPHQIISNAFRIDTNAGSIVYSGDTGSENDLRNFSRNADIFICESTYLEGQIRTNNYHLYASEASKIARDSNVGQLLLTHFWPHISKELYVKEAKEYFNNTTYLDEGESLILKK